MKIEDTFIYHRANKILKELYGENALFRDGQYEAIESIFTKKRTLVVERTGWGKSLVYFISTKILREDNNSPTIVISPLLSLMKNQEESASKLGLKTAMINSYKTTEEKNIIIENWINNELDIIFVTPESLFSKIIQTNIDKLKIGLFVVDEAHCISDWGHDFRLEYMRLSEIIQILPSNVPILATTATATNRVIDDLKSQLGENIYVSRGPLTRESLNIQMINLENMAYKYAWILENINDIPGTGIIYCLTKNDCDNLTEFLTLNGIDAISYHSGIEEIINYNSLQLLNDNKIKVIVSTIKLGMGYDKADISFIIHLQIPSNIVGYYQQIGRAGRNIENAYIFLLYGKDDGKIVNYFINNAFPKEYAEKKIYNVIANSDGIKLKDIYSRVNLKYNQIKKILQFLEKDKYIVKDNGIYYATSNTYKYNQEYYEKIKEIRRQEIKKMYELVNTDICYSKFIVNALDDYSAKKCQKCSNCINRNILPTKMTDKYLKNAINYIYNKFHIIEPRKRDELNKKLLYINEMGICLSYYGDYGYGSMVEYDKYHSTEYRDEILNRSVEIINEELIKKYDIKYITYIPSNNNDLIKKLAYKIADELEITCLELLIKKNGEHQKNMENSYFQSQNAKNSYIIKENNIEIDKIILLDDMVDSKWTLTWCGYYLMEQGIEKVYPFVLSNSSNRSEE